MAYYQPIIHPIGKKELRGPVFASQKDALAWEKQYAGAHFLEVGADTSVFAVEEKSTPSLPPSFIDNDHDGLS